MEKWKGLIGRMPDNLDVDLAALAAYLGLDHWEMLQVLAKGDGRTPKEQIKFLIRARFSGQMRHLGDVRDPALSDLAGPVQPGVRSLEIERIGPEFDDRRKRDPK